jgi:DNA polymerase-1
MPAILIDASGYIYRAFYALPPVERSDGLPVGCVLGFVRMLWGMKRRHVGATHFAVVFDKGKSARRTAIFPEYKANRKPQPEPLLRQLDLVRDATRAFGLPGIEADNVEADDLLASYAHAFAAAEHDVVIVSSDKDLFQVVSGPEPGRGAIGLYCPMKDRRLGRDDCIAKLGVSPRRALDAQALIGDAVDNIPGVPKIGVKTAASSWPHGARSTACSPTPARSPSPRSGARWRPTRIWPTCRAIWRGSTQCRCRCRCAASRPATSTQKACSPSRARWSSRPSLPTWPRSMECRHERRAHHHPGGR